TFDAAIVKLNWDENIRLQQPHLAGQFLNFTAGTRLEVIDLYTVRFVFPEPDGTALIKLSSMHMGNRQFYAEHGWGEGGPLNWPPSAHTVAGNGAPLSWGRAEAEQAARNPSADAVAG